MGFADSVRIASSKIQSEVNAKIVAIATELFTDVVAGTPVLTGNLIDNWYAGQGIGNYSDECSPSLDTGASNSLAQIASIAESTAFMGMDNEISLANNTEYAYRAEVLGWPKPDWSGHVGPYAMVKNAILVASSKYK